MVGNIECFQLKRFDLVLERRCIYHYQHRWQRGMQNLCYPRSISRLVELGLQEFEYRNFLVALLSVVSFCQSGCIHIERNLRNPNQWFSIWNNVVSAACPRCWTLVCLRTCLSSLVIVLLLIVVALSSLLVVSCPCLCLLLWTCWACLSLLWWRWSSCSRVLCWIINNQALTNCQWVP